jgi:predicted adenylyl cyclase CyaB
MLNLELKTRCTNLVRAEEIACRLGATPGGMLHQVDTYFKTSNGRLKLRQINRAAGELIYYERSEDSAVRWSNYFTAVVPDCAAMRDVLTRTYGVHMQVEKERMLYLYRKARIHLDQVEGLGSFIEFESPVHTESDEERERARSIMNELISAFGLDAKDAIQASYADMLQARSAQRVLTQ